MRKKIEAFTTTAIEYLGEDVVNDIYKIEIKVIQDNASGDDNGDPHFELTRADPEGQRLPFPSSIRHAYLVELTAGERAKITRLQNSEFEIRRGHANDALDLVRGAVIHLSWQFVNGVRNEKSQKRSTRAWGTVNVLTAILKLNQRIYNHNQHIMVAHGGEEVEKIFRRLTDKDCEVSTETVKNPNTPGQSSRRLPWFWSSTSTVVAEGQHSDECEMSPT